MSNALNAAGAKNNTRAIDRSGKKMLAAHKVNVSVYYSRPSTLERLLSSVLCVTRRSIDRSSKAFYDAFLLSQEMCIQRRHSFDSKPQGKRTDRCEEEGLNKTIT